MKTDIALHLYQLVISCVVLNDFINDMNNGIKINNEIDAIPMPTIITICVKVMAFEKENLRV